ncbi:MAG: RNA polymerase sigma factor [Myxococcaceae bacterium]|nr:RNA polymerase sigma factor [Myxococcaceae bacterium]
MLRLLARKAPVEKLPIDKATPEESLVERAQAGEAEAFKALFDRHVGSVRRFLRDVVRDATAADEATQETFVRAHAQLARLEQRARVKAWLLGIARNVAFEQRRSRKDEVELDDSEAPIEAVIPSPDPERLLLDRELERQFDTALGTLSTHRRAALVLRLDHGLGYEEIATLMGWSLPMVKNEIHRARLKLREAMLPHLGGRS